MSLLWMIASAPGVVGPLAPSASTRHFSLPAFFSSITRSSAAGTANVHSWVSNSCGSSSSPPPNWLRGSPFATCAARASIFSPFLLRTAPVLSPTARTFTPRFTNSWQVTDPTLPKPCTTAVAVSGRIFSSSRAAMAVITTPRPVASRRPTIPPISTGLPVTISGQAYPTFML